MTAEEQLVMNLILMAAPWIIYAMLVALGD